ncbi:AAA domain-containing protein [Mrakia frigida]|uniref:nucleoside-triphosphatase n=1 Tax=Mrakia frigida TaxID=29902 RepID=UPI003FCC11EF
MSPLPNILITGTPGTGKTTFSQMLVESLGEGFKNVNVGDVVKDEKAHNGWDEEWEAWNVDEDKLLDALDPLFPALNAPSSSSKGGVILDYHTCDIFPERWIDLVVVLRCDHSVLWERLEARKYPLKKIQENNEAEIMETVLSEAQESYSPSIVLELPSTEHSDMEAALDKVKEWVETWVEKKKSE